MIARDYMPHYPQNHWPSGGTARLTGKKLEVAAGLETAKIGFADRRLDHFGKHAREVQDGESGGREVTYPRAELADAAVQFSKLGKWGREVCPKFALICLNRPVQHVTFQQAKLL